MLSSNSKIRWGGPAAVLGGLTVVTNALLGAWSIVEGGPRDLLFATALALTTVGLGGFHAL